jgi:hypothetical protein
MSKTLYYFLVMTFLLIVGLCTTIYLSSQLNIPFIFLLGIIALIITEHKGASDIRDALVISNAIKAAQLEEIKEKNEKTYQLVKRLHKDSF